MMLFIMLLPSSGNPIYDKTTRRAKVIEQKTRDLSDAAMAELIWLGVTNLFRHVCDSKCCTVPEFGIVDLWSVDEAEEECSLLTPSEAEALKVSVLLSCMYEEDFILFSLWPASIVESLFCWIELSFPSSPLGEAANYQNPWARSRNNKIPVAIRCIIRIIKLIKVFEIRNLFLSIYT